MNYYLNIALAVFEAVHRQLFYRDISLIINFFELLFKYSSGSIRGSAQTATLQEYLTAVSQTELESIPFLISLEYSWAVLLKSEGAELHPVTEPLIP